ncbi:MAG: hypothetical protein WC399_01035 [Bacilli bacterium]|jgi:hypothetical protein
MRLVVLRNELEKYLTTKYKLEPLFEEDKDFMVAKCNIKFRDFDDGVYLRITAYEEGSATITFIFDKIDLTLETMLRINAFNENIHWLKAYVNENSFLAFKHPIIDAVIESNVVEALDYLIKILTNEETKKHLAPLTELTYAE